MAELTFTSKLTWSGGRLSRGLVEAGGEVFGFSVPASMGGLGAGTNPEELLLSAVGSCYTATLAATLEAGHLPAASLKVRVDGRLSDYPGRSARVSTITVNPTFAGVEPGRSADYESAAGKARERCFIGSHLDPQVDYRVGDVAFVEASAEEPDVLDVRALPLAQRHELIFGRLGDLPAGSGITLVNDHDPKPLRHQLDATDPGRFSWDYLERGPAAWRVRIARIA
jgi:peroxiredoxin-like protein